jgi:aminoglycoside phosphotransferase (APT) family kinase protein
MNIDKKSVPPYLRRKKIIVQGERITDIQPVGDGVKNILYRVVTTQKRLIVKQARSRSNDKIKTFLDRKRIFQEKSCLEVLSQILPPDIVPQVYLEDRTDFILVSEAPARDAVLWDNELGLGKVDLQIAAQCGELLATVHNHTKKAAELKAVFKPTKPFEQLRLEPLYKAMIPDYPEQQKLIEAQARALTKETVVLVLGDLRPRNVWVNSGQVFLVDFAAAHFGHPSFDAAFYASDLCLKAILNSPQKAAYLEAINVFWMGYFKQVTYAKKAEVERNAVRDFGCLLLSAAAGRMPRLELEEERKDLTVRIGQSLLFTELDKIEDITEFINRTLIDG